MGHDQWYGDVPASVPKQPKCIGLFGRIFGHKFKKGIDSVRFSNTCFRCGFVVPDMKVTRG